MQSACARHRGERVTLRSVSSVERKVLGIWPLDHFPGVGKKVRTWYGRQEFSSCGKQRHVTFIHEWAQLRSMYGGQVTPAARCWRWLRLRHAGAVEAEEGWKRGWVDGWKGWRGRKSVIGTSSRHLWIWFFKAERYKGASSSLFAFGFCYCQSSDEKTRRLEFRKAPSAETCQVLFPRRSHVLALWLGILPERVSMGVCIYLFIYLFILTIIFIFCGCSFVLVREREVATIGR